MHVMGYYKEQLTSLQRRMLETEKLASEFGMDPASHERDQKTLENLVTDVVMSTEKFAKKMNGEYGQGAATAIGATMKMFLSRTKYKKFVSPAYGYQKLLSKNEHVLISSIICCNKVKLSPWNSAP